MKFFGTQNALEGWSQIIETRLGRECSAIVEEDDRLHFVADLSDDDLNVLQNEFWYEKADDSDMPWNWRIAFQAA